MVAASTVSTDGEKLECLYVGRVSRGSEEERHLLETVDSIEGSLSATVFVCACLCLCVSLSAFVALLSKQLLFVSP